MVILSDQWMDIHIDRSLLCTLLSLTLDGSLGEGFGDLAYGMNEAVEFFYCVIEVSGGSHSSILLAKELLR